MNEKEILKSLYNNLAFQLERSKKRKYSSVLFDILKIKSNDRLKLLSEAADDLSDIDTFIVNKLTVENLIKENEIGQYYISARGVWKVESEEKEQIEELLDFFDVEYFTNKSLGKDLSDKEKVILISLIAIRAFSQDTALDLKKDELIKDSCGDVLEYFNEKLAEHGVLKKKVIDFWGKSGNEHKVSNIIRHTDELPKKTRMIYINGYNSEQKYFLNLVEDNEIKLSDLKFIIQKIFEEAHIDYIHIKEIIKDLNYITYSKGPNIFNDMSKSFIQSKYDTVISKAVEDAIMDI